MGGALYLVSGILGTITFTSLPIQEINRHNEPERFRFCHSMMAAAFLCGVLLLAISVVV
jgi:hypothetical protein